MAGTTSKLRKGVPFYDPKQDPTGKNSNITIKPDSIGLNGWSLDVDRLAANTPYRQSNFIPLMTRTMAIFKDHKRGKELTQFLQRVVEEWPSEWSGLDFKMSLDTTQTKVGHDDQSISSVTRVTRPEITVSLKGPEIYGRTIAKFLEYLVYNFYKYPGSQAPALADMAVPRSAIKDYLLDKNTFDIILMEPDPHRGDIVDAYWLVGCTITDLPSHELKFSTSDGDKVEDATWQFKCMVRSGPMVVAQAKKFFKEMRLSEIDFIKSEKVYEGYDDSIKDANNGLVEDADRLAKETQ